MLRPLRIVAIMVIPGLFPCLGAVSEGDRAIRFEPPQNVSGLFMASAALRESPATPRRRDPSDHSVVGGGAAGACPKTASCYPGCAEVGEILLCGEALYTAVGWVAAVALVAAAEGISVAKLCETEKICIDSAPMKPKPAAKPKTVAQTKTATLTPIPCRPNGGDQGPGRFKPARIAGAWIRCVYMCGPEELRKYRTFDPGIEDDCWDPKSFPMYP